MGLFETLELYIGLQNIKYSDFREEQAKSYDMSDSGVIYPKGSFELAQNLLLINESYL
jgi:hypothetical protein